MNQPRFSKSIEPSPAPTNGCLEVSLGLQNEGVIPSETARYDAYRISLHVDGVSSHSQDQPNNTPRKEASSVPLGAAWPVSYSQGFRFICTSFKSMTLRPLNLFTDLGAVNKSRTDLEAFTQAREPDNSAISPSKLICSQIVNLACAVDLDLESRTIIIPNPATELLIKLSIRT